MLQELKLMLGIGTDDTSEDEKLRLLISTATSRLKQMLGGIEPPDDLLYIVREVANKRYNRIGSEGMSSHGVEGESVNFSDDDFAEFADEIQAFLDRQKDSARGRVCFL